MSEINVNAAIEELDKVLSRVKKEYTLYTCGGAALIYLGFDERRTGDVDIIAREIDKPLREAMIEVADKLGISKNWINNEVADLDQKLPKGWQSKCKKLFDGKSLTLMCISRQDLINSKVHAMVARGGQDYKDLIWLNPNANEVSEAEVYTLKQDSAPTWPVFVGAYLKELKNELGIK